MSEGPAGGAARPSVEKVASAALPVLTLFVRVGCHLCEDMAEQLHELFEPGSFRLEQIDIDEDLALKARYDVDVPVLVHPDGEICRHFLDPLAVKEWLAGYNGGLT